MDLLNDISNQVAVIILVAIYVLSKKKELTGVIIFFYAAYISLEFFSNFVHMSAMDWAISNALIDLIVIFLCYHIVVHKNNSIIALLYGAYVLLFYLVPELIAANLSLELVNAATNYAIIIDIAFALLSSTSVMARLTGGEVYK